MNIKKIAYPLALAGLGLYISACNNTKYLPAGQSLYIGAKVKITDSAMPKSERKLLQSQLEDLTRPKPNASILGLRPKLWFWNIGDTPKKKFSVKRLIKNLGEPPVLLSDLNLKSNVDILENNLENSGYFKASVAGDTNIVKRRATAVYTARAGKRYRINEVFFPDDSSKLQQAINRTKRRTLFKKKEPFTLDLVKLERARIDNRLKQRGFYYFNEEDLIVDVDSTIGNNLVNLYLRVKPETSELAKKAFRIDDIVIYPTYDLNTARSDTNPKFGVMHEGYYVVDSGQAYKPKLFQQAMQFKKGDLYNRTEHNATLNRLINLGIFKFVKNEFRLSGDTLLDAYYYLTPQPRQSLRVELGGLTKSNNLTGSQISVGYTNRNTFRGGEILNVTASGGAEVQVSGQFKGYNTYRYGAEANLAIPRFVVPFVYLNPRGGFVPRTNIQLGYDVLTREKLFTLNSLRGAYGYIWKENEEKEHTFYPISVQYVQPVNIKPGYDSAILVDRNLQKIVDTQFILGANYNYLFNQLSGRRRRNAFYLNQLVDVSGNIAGLIKKSVIKEGDTARLFGAPFSQYLKLETDFRYYKNLGGEKVWANRIIVGLGFPYGNSRELPFIKQFFIGGNNSIRAFRSRALGPGTYDAQQAAVDNKLSFVPDQSGDMKLEMNSELRFPIFSPVYGAVFVDAGNIWLRNENPGKPGSKFESDFLSELAVGTGLGIRVDVSILVVRLDLAFPLRKPVLAPGNRWVFDEIQFNNKEWRQNNLIFNLGIGYPF